MSLCSVRIIVCSQNLDLRQFKILSLPILNLKQSTVTTNQYDFYLLLKIQFFIQYG